MTSPRLILFVGTALACSTGVAGAGSIIPIMVKDSQGQSPPVHVGGLSQDGKAGVLNEVNADGRVWRWSRQTTAEMGSVLLIAASVGNQATKAEMFADWTGNKIGPSGWPIAGAATRDRAVLDEKDRVVKVLPGVRDGALAYSDGKGGARFEFVDGRYLERNGKTDNYLNRRHAVVANAMSENGFVVGGIGRDVNDDNVDPRMPAKPAYIWNRDPKQGMVMLPYLSEDEPSNAIIDATDVSRGGELIVGFTYADLKVNQVVDNTTECGGPRDEIWNGLGGSGRVGALWFAGKPPTGEQPPKEPWIGPKPIWADSNVWYFTDGDGLILGPARDISPDGRWTVGQLSQSLPCVYSFWLFDKNKRDLNKYSASAKKFGSLDLRIKEDAVESFNEVWRLTRVSVSDDGNVIAAGVYSIGLSLGAEDALFFESLPEATIWRRDNDSQEFKKVTLAEYAKQLRIDISGWSLENATAVSGDGLTIGGTGLYKGRHTAFIMDLRPNGIRIIP